MLDLVKKVLKSVPIAFTKNQKYDLLTKIVIKKSCNAYSNCIDVGCHKGEVLDIIIKNAPDGKHFGFEPLPHLYQSLVKKYEGSNASIFNLALSNQSGEASFNYVISNPSYSGLIKRKYDKPNEEDTQITVKTERLDDMIPENIVIDLIKIDVEGGELLVLEGAKKLLSRCHPVVVFEHGLGASEYYGATPEKVFDLMESCGLHISLLDDFLAAKPPLTKAQFSVQFYQKLNYYFVASV